MYADDTTIYTIGSSTDEVVITLQLILQSWCQINRLIKYEGKTDALILNTQPFIGPLKPLLWGDKVIKYKLPQVNRKNHS